MSFKSFLAPVLSAGLIVGAALVVAPAASAAPVAAASVTAASPSTSCLATDWSSSTEITLPTGASVPATVLKGGPNLQPGDPGGEPFNLGDATDESTNGPFDAIVDPDDSSQALVAPVPYDDPSWTVSVSALAPYLDCDGAGPATNDAETCDPTTERTDWTAVVAEPQTNPVSSNVTPTAFDGRALLPLPSQDSVTAGPDLDDPSKLVVNWGGVNGTVPLSKMAVQGGTELLCDGKTATVAGKYGAQKVVVAKPTATAKPSSSAKSSTSSSDSGSGSSGSTSSTTGSSSVSAKQTATKTTVPASAHKIPVIWIVAGALVILVLGGLVFGRRKKPGAKPKASDSKQD